MLKKISGVVLITFLLALSDAALAEKKAIGQDLVPPGTAYSPGLLVNDTLYISGLQGTDTRTHALPKEFGDEAKDCLENIGRVLKQAGMNYSDVVSVQIFLVDMSQFQQVNALYKSYFSAPYPTRTTLQVVKLSLGARIEISAIARK